MKTLITILLFASTASAQQPPPVFNPWAPVAPAPGYYYHPGIGGTKTQVVMPGGGIMEVGGGGQWLPMPDLSPRAIAKAPPVITIEDIDRIIEGIKRDRK